MFIISRSSHRRGSVKKMCSLKFRNTIGKYLCWNQFFNFIIISKLFWNYLRTSANDCFYNFVITLMIIFTFITFTTIRSSRSQMFYKIGVLKNVANLTGKHLCWSTFFNKVADLNPEKKTPTQAFFCEICKILKNIFSCRTPPL